MIPGPECNSRENRTGWRFGKDQAEEGISEHDSGPLGPSASPVSSKKGSRRGLLSNSYKSYPMVKHGQPEISKIVCFLVLGYECMVEQGEQTAGDSKCDLQQLGPYAKALGSQSLRP